MSQPSSPSHAVLRRADLDSDPIRQFDRWFQAAIAADLRDPNAMTLATVAPDGAPDARIVLLKGYDARGFTFFTNYQSPKGCQLAANPRVALILFWPTLERQIRITGSVGKVSREESEEYFHTRPVGSQIGAWASRQSSGLPNRDELQRRFEEQSRRFANQEVPLPPYWGGYRVTPGRIEFWQGQPSRLHDRFLYTRRDVTEWKIERLSP